MKRMILVFILAASFFLPVKSEPGIIEHACDQVKWEYSNTERVFKEKGVVNGLLHTPLAVVNSAWNIVEDTYQRVVNKL